MDWQGSHNTGSLGKKVWDNFMLTIGTKMKVYKACMLSTLLYDSES